MRDDFRAEQTRAGSRTRARVLRAVGNVAIFALALAVACGAIRASLPFPKVPGIYEKYLHFSRNKADYDVLFTGSSRVYRAIIPEQFDASVAAATGVKVRSFNVAYDAAQPPEGYFVLRKTLALRPPRLRWVFVEASPIESDLVGQRSPHRFAYWHDARHTSLVLRSIAGERISFREKSRRWSEHGTHALIGLTNTDRGAQWLRPRLVSKKAEKPSRWDPPKEWAGREGYAPLFDTRLAGKTLSRYFEKVAVQTPGPVLPMPGLWRRELDALVAEIRAAGAQPLFLFTPSVRGRENYTGYPEDIPLFRFQDPAKFPELFDPAHHYDQAHLNDAGARVLTDLVAARFAQMLKGRQ